MVQTDSLGRATFHHIAPKPDVIPTERELRWLKHIDRHGPQSSRYLYELTRDTHRCRDTALRELQKLRAGGLLALPPQQRQTAKAEFRPYIYDLTPKAHAYLRGHGLAAPTVRPRGHWWHSYAVSCVTSAVDIAAARDGARYIPAHEILTIRKSTLAISIGRQRLIPDQLFALDYGGRYRAFVLEVDRGTEPHVSAAARKSIAASIALYSRVFEDRLWMSHYGLKANLLALWVFTSARKAETFLNMAARAGGAVASQTLVHSLPPGTASPEVAGTAQRLFQSAWLRPRGDPVLLSVT